MALLTLKDIGKIYVSDGNVAVGIRGVNLSFDKGEFVAITGKSGSGKSTLLNVISGMDSYEEGELYIEGMTTSHYLQPEWEEYRQKYISFIFQDYNIIESFTVLQNVELALMHISDKKERRRRAMELIERVGLASHAKHKGSKLSGGQKQRTVIARALAKDSPIILADEPTGNLDSATSAEIIKLLREVSKDKLLIMVTHNFEQVEDHVTRHIRVFDGAVESDQVFSRPEGVTIEETPEVAKTPKKGKKQKPAIPPVKNGITLGRAIFTSKPKLSAFLCLLMVIGTLGIFVVTSLCGEASELWEKHYMFTPIDGRVVMTTQNGAVLSEDEVKAIAEEYGAEDYLMCDSLLDASKSIAGYAYIETPEKMEGISVRYTYGEHFGDDIIGRYPEAPNEVFLNLPISWKSDVGSTEILADSIKVCDVELKIVGVSYYYDNNIQPQCLFTEDGFRAMTAIYYFTTQSNVNIYGAMYAADGSNRRELSHMGGFIPSFDIEDGKVYIKEYVDFVTANPDTDWKTEIDFRVDYFNYDFFSSVSSENRMEFSRKLSADDLIKTDYPLDDKDAASGITTVVSVSLIEDMAYDVLSKSYKQVSLFFADNASAHEAAVALSDAGYIAVPSDTTYTPSADETMSNMMQGILMAFVWIVAILFLAFFVNLCSSRMIGAFKGDMAIMRSMGIPVKVIRTGMYVRMLITLIPAYAFVVLAAFMIFTVPQFNAIFAFLYPWQYALIFIGMFLLTVRVTHKQIRRLFGESVKKSLKGGNAE